MNTPKTRDRDYELSVLLNITSDAIMRAREKELIKHGISSIEAGVLFIVESIGDRAIPAEISRWIFREQHTVSALLVRMEKKGLIKKTKDLEKKNLVRVSLTEKGKQALDNSKSRESIHKIIPALSKEQRQQLNSYLRTLRDRAFEEIRLEHRPPFPPDN
jgi:DNA-binding MarR family transcriptional regulator